MNLDPIVLAGSAVLAIIAVLGWCAAVLFFGLWMGEKGRRRDIALLTGRDAEARRASGPHATVRRREPPEEAAARQAETEALVAGLEELAEAEGKRFSREELVEEARRLQLAMDPTNMTA